MIAFVSFYDKTNKERINHPTKVCSERCKRAIKSALEEREYEGTLFEFASVLHFNKRNLCGCCGK